MPSLSVSLSKVFFCIKIELVLCGYSLKVLFFQSILSATSVTILYSSVRANFDSRLQVVSLCSYFVIVKPARETTPTPHPTRRAPIQPQIPETPSHPTPIQHHSRNPRPTIDRATLNEAPIPASTPPGPNMPRGAAGHRRPPQIAPWTPARTIAPQFQSPMHDAANGHFTALCMKGLNKQ